jgi:hypothetical protein
MRNSTRPGHPELRVRVPVPRRRVLGFAALAVAGLGAGLGVTGGLAARGGQPVEQPSAFDRPLQTTEHVIYVPAGDATSPSDAGEMGLLSRLARVSNLPFGFESDGEAPRSAPAARVERRVITASTPRAALDAFVAMDPRYRWKDVGGVFVVRTAAAWDDPRNALNQPVRNVHWHDLHVLSAFDRIAHVFYPGDPRAYFEGIRDTSNRSFNVDVSEGTILGVLDAAVRDDGELGWWVAYGNASDRQRFTLTLGHYGNGPTAGWAERPAAKK